ncbi:hypothetical protein [Parahaliea aestuarii]|uniref:Uncharacterized protein n=1 Tax=Parahaliea aestuarii TaxID=1852021 RepID=A0A5C9A2K8_9GAMM|nr:hypothetical protein [Parahaliea aestuarii]TXS93571.1 hypothetical protein FVW59_07040 [Parahaliea aestuarii]
MKYSSKYLRIAALAAAIAAPGAFADGATQQTDWMQLVKGYKDQKVGAELRDIQVEDTFGGQKVTIAIPKSAMAHPDTMEEVRVVGQRPEQMEFEFPIDFRHEWVDDYDNDFYGLVLYLGKDATMPIRLYMESSSGFTQ